MKTPGDNCKAHLATSIADRAPLLCRRWVPGFARTCSECGAPSPAERLAVLIKNFVRGPGNGGDVEKATRRGTHAHGKARPRVRG